MENTLPSHGLSYSPTLEEEVCKDMLYMAAAVVLSLLELEPSEAELVEWSLPGVETFFGRKPQKGEV